MRCSKLIIQSNDEKQMARCGVLDLRFMIKTTLNLIFFFIFLELNICLRLSLSFFNRKSST